MNDALTFFFGPLATPECSRASRRGWLIWVRMLPAIASGLVAFVALWLWWIGQQIDSAHQPFMELRTALTTIEGMIVAFAMLMTPAVLAGSLAGDKERGSIGLLLTTRVNSAEIVMGRMAGRLSQVVMIELAALPCLLLVAAMSGFGWGPCLTLVALPMGLAIGSGGLAMAASAMSRRGRDALLFVYLVEILFLLSPMLATMGGPWIATMSPFETIGPLTWSEDLAPSLTTAGVWASTGLLGLVLASWRLRPACLSEGVDAKARKRARRRSWVPPLDDERPMLWKELYVERVGTLGRAGRWIGGLLVFWLTIGSLGLAGCAAWGYFHPGDSSWTDWAIVQSSIWYGNSAIFIGLLIQWAIGLRAAVTISSERERGTWDALLTSPMDGTEIIRGKLWGSLWALKWLVVSAVLAWTITLALGGMFWPEYVEQLISLAVIGTFMSAVGVRTSLRGQTATMSMGVTMGLWLAARLVVYVVAWIVCLAVTIVCLLGWLYAIQLGLTTFKTAPWFPMSFRLGQDLLIFAQYLAGAILIVVETRFRFDRVAGRMTGGKTAIAIDRLIQGMPMPPVRLDGRTMVDEPKMDELVG